MSFLGYLVSLLGSLTQKHADELFGFHDIRFMLNPDSMHTIPKKSVGASEVINGLVRDVNGLIDLAHYFEQPRLVMEDFSDLVDSPKASHTERNRKQLIQSFDYWTKNEWRPINIQILIAYADHKKITSKKSINI